MKHNFFVFSIMAMFAICIYPRFAQADGPEPYIEAVRTNLLRVIQIFCDGKACEKKYEKEVKKFHDDKVTECCSERYNPPFGESKWEIFPFYWTNELPPVEYKPENLKKRDRHHPFGNILYEVLGESRPQLCPQLDGHWPTREEDFAHENEAGASNPVHSQARAWERGNVTNKNLKVFS